MKNIGENSITKKVLDYLKDTSKALLILSAKIIFDPHSLMKGMGLYWDYTRPHFSRNIAYLKKSRCFNFKKNKFYLTPRGRVEIIKNIIKEKRNKKLKWDGKWRGIIFDIPELKRRDRRFLRNELKWIGFQELQKSVWIYPYDIEQELKVLLKLWKLDFRGDIRFILVEKTDDKDLKKRFNLS